MSAADFDKRVAEVKSDYIKRRQDWGQVAISKRAKELGLSLSQSSVSRWLNGEAKPRIDSAESLATVLGVTPEWLSFGRGEKYPHDVVRTDEVTDVPLDNGDQGDAKRAG